MKPQHTPTPYSRTPWETGDNGKSVFEGNNGPLIATITYPITGNAALIVRAVNAHEAMISALIDFAEIAAMSKPNCGDKMRALIQQAQVKHSAALKTAKGEV